jgi:MoxR-like ATPase
MNPEEYHEKIERLYEEVGKVIVGQRLLINRLLIGIFTGGHILLEGSPGLAKTKTISVLASTLRLRFHRIQFTPDLLPADIIGTMVYNQKEAQFFVRKGPVFANVILADEINRAPAKVQSALLEAMQEKQVTIGEESFPLERPFFVLATQNPLEHEGTYPLPEAQLDRFMMRVQVGYLSKEEELEVMRRMASFRPLPSPESVLGPEDIFAIRELLNEVTLSESLERYIVELVFATRYPKDYGIEEGKYIEYGASPRATIALNVAARAYAFLQKRNFVLPDDIKAIAPDVLNHRLILNYEAEADRVSAYEVIRAILNHVPIS